MGRGLMLFIVGMFIVMGIFNYGTQNRLLSSEEDMSKQVHYMMASSIAQSGLEEAAQQIVLSNVDFSTQGHTWPIEHENGVGEVTMIFRSGNNIHLRSEVTTEEAVARVTGEYTLITGGDMPSLEGA